MVVLLVLSAKGEGIYELAGAQSIAIFAPPRDLA
jgi:hypothetical protein